MRKNWAMGFLGLFSLLGLRYFQTGEWLYLIWFSWILWFTYLLPEKMINTKNIGTLLRYLLLPIGLIILLIYAVGYILGLDFNTPALAAIGLIFVAVGTCIARNKN